MQERDKECKYLETEYISSWHSDIFDHPSYKNICTKKNKKVITFIQCKRCKEYEEGE